MRKRRANTEEEAELNEVNVIPLADVCLTLVIIIMVVSPMMLQAMIQVQPSQAVATARKDMVAERPLFVDVANGGFTLNGKRIGSEEDLYRQLSRQLLRMTERTVLISAAAEVPYAQVVRILDVVRQSGARSLSLVPRREKS